MNGQEWLASKDPAVMLLHLTADPHDPAVNDRKLRLFACACCRMIWPLLADARSRAAVEAAERYADSLITADELAAVWDAAWDATSYTAAWAAARDAAWAAAWAAVRAAARAAAWAATRAKQAALLRDIAGNPWKPVTLPGTQTEIHCTACGRLNPTVHFSTMRCLECGQEEAEVRQGCCPWLTPSVTLLAGCAYEDRRPDGTLDPLTLLALSDALEEADCSDAGLLTHLREPGPHVRGCWALDLILRKE